MALEPLVMPNNGGRMHALKPDPYVSRRDLIKAAAGAGLMFATGANAAAGAAELAPITGAAKAITPGEREARIRRAQKLMGIHGLSAIAIEPGASLDYFTGVQWRRSERATLAMIPAEGPVGFIVPRFEEGSIREMLQVPADVRVWEEDGDPYVLAKRWLDDRKLGSGRVAVEETVRYFLVEGLNKVIAGPPVTSAAPVVRACRMIKSPAELDLLKAAADVMVAAYRHTHPQVRGGMTPSDIASIVNGAVTALGANPTFALILVGEASAYPHGIKAAHAVRDGDIVLMDCGCEVAGYQADVSRTFVFGTPSPLQRKVWDQVHHGQQVAFGTAKAGVAAGKVDEAVRAYYHSIGYGSNFEAPGLTHRTGHGIGLDVHEPINLVRGERASLAPGMCFSNEPGIYIPGSFGVRIEDCFYLTPEGPHWFSTPPTSLDQPMG